MPGFTSADNEPLWGLTVTEPAGPAGPIDQLMTELLDIEDDIATAVIWIAEHWSTDLPVITWGTGDQFKGYALRLKVNAASHDVLNQLARLLDAPVTATEAHHNKVWWHAQRRFGTVLLDTFYGEPIEPTAAAYIARYLDKAAQPDSGAA